MRAAAQPAQGFPVSWPSMYADMLQHDMETVMSVRETLVRAPLCSDVLGEAQQSRP